MERWIVRSWLWFESPELMCFRCTSTARQAWSISCRAGMTGCLTTSWSGCSPGPRLGCYNPVNLQSRRLSCSEGFEAAQRHVHQAFFVGLVENYHVSLCLLSAKVNGTLPPGCSCADQGDEDTPRQSHFTHGVHLHSPEHLPSSQLDMIDELTREDSWIYEMARKRFWVEVQRVERIFQAKIVCGEERSSLSTPRSELSRHVPAPGPRLNPLHTPPVLVPPRPPPQALELPALQQDPSKAPEMVRVRMPPRKHNGKDASSLLDVSSGSELRGCPNEGYLQSGTGTKRH